jgi:hypothetical protein
MDVRWLAYVTSGVLAAVSLAPVTMFRSAESEAAKPRTAPRTASRQPVPLLLDVERHTARLHAYTSDAPAPRAPARNPFRFAPRHAVRAEPPLGVVDTGNAAPAEEAPAPPQLALVGMAEHLDSGTVVRTAVISGFGDVHLVTLGGRIANRFTVTAVGPDAVELRDDATATVLRLTLEHQR